MFFVLTCAIFSHPSYSEPPNLSLLKEEIQVYHDSGAYRKELAGVINCATHFVNQRAAANLRRAHPEKLAIVLDIDETSLSNYKRIVSQSFCCR